MSYSLEKLRHTAAVANKRMKGFVILMLLVILGVLAYFPFVLREKKCYDTSKKSLDDIGYFTTARNWGVYDVCQKRFDTLLDLEICIQTATGTGVIARYSNGLIQGLVAMVRPVEKGLYTYKSEHNQECTEFIKYQLE